MGGQVGDSGTITCGENVFTVTDTRKSGSGHFIHVGTVTHGTFQMGDTVTAAVDENRRMSIMRNHYRLPPAAKRHCRRSWAIMSIRPVPWWMIRSAASTSVTSPP